MADIVDEVNHLHQQGIQEIVLTGVHVGGYGSDIDSSLTDLVKILFADTDIPRIRFASVEPWDLPEDFFTLFENKRLMPHMHLPLQSGANSVLRRMSRRCKVEDFSTLIQQARTAIPEFNVTTDIIVGFPGETDEEWASTLKNVESIGFGHMHIFAFSPREGTKAAGLQNQIAEEIKKQRSHELHLLADELKKDFHQQQINQQVDVLWEGQKNNEEGKLVYTGYAPNFCRVESIGQNDVLLEGRVKRTQILDYSSTKSVLMGKVL
jgi:threonylcarbamoyladenosine tRNA methylthiotransferase MtaB